MPRPRILYIGTYGNVGGVQTHIHHCAAAFKEEFEIEVCAGTEGAFSDSIRSLSIPFHLIHALEINRPSVADFAAISKLIALIKRFKPDLVSCHSTKGGFLGRIAAAITHAPVLFTAHGWAFRGPWIRRKVAPSIERFLARRTQKIICVSEYDRQLALAHGVGDPNKLVTVRNGIPRVDGNTAARPGGSEKIILTMVARFAVPKNHLLLLQALSKLNVPQEWEMRFVGSGELENTVRLDVVQKGLTEKIRFLGERTGDVAELLSESHVFLLISNWEGFPRSILEAMRAGLPVIATKVGGIPEAILEGETGFLIPPENTDLLTRRMETLIENPDLRKKMGEAGRKRFLEYFTLDKMLSKTRDIYYELSEIPRL